MQENLQPILPLTEATFYILLSLATDSKHGYAILKHVEDLSERAVMLSTSTLYSALLRLLDQGLIVRIDAGTELAANPGLPRKAYVLTDQGRQALKFEMARLRRQLRAGQRYLGEEYVG